MNRLRIGYVVQRYGVEVNGGSETHCRGLAERLARNNDVDVLTTRAIDYVTWKDEYPEGAETINGVCVRRFGVDQPRMPAQFDAASQTVFLKPHTEADELRWMELQGPYSTPLLTYLKQNRSAYDVFLFQTYLYATTYFGLPLVADRAVLIPTAHDELPIYLDIFDTVFRKARHLLCLTPEELAFLRRRFFDIDLKGDVLGSGIDPIPDPSPDPRWEALRERLGNSPFILYVGRIDESKGCRILIEFFERYLAEFPGTDLKLLMVGKAVMPVSGHPRIVLSGFVPEATKYWAIRECRFMVAPSPYESLCIAALEAWLLGKPVLVNGDCAVLRGQCIRSNGGLWYTSYGEFREAVNCLLNNDALACALGVQGEAFVRANYAWEEVDKCLMGVLSSIAATQPAPGDQGLCLEPSSV
jgi:glycosyltransferase involved in cell wall biosynthesis